MSQRHADQVAEQPERLAAQQRRETQGSTRSAPRRKDRDALCVSSSFRPAIRPSSEVPAAKPLKVRKLQQQRDDRHAPRRERACRGGASRPARGQAPGESRRKTRPPINQTGSVLRCASTRERGRRAVHLQLGVRDRAWRRRRELHGAGPRAAGARQGAQAAGAMRSAASRAMSMPGILSP